MGILLSAFFSLDTISDKATDIYNRAEEEISKLDPSTLPPGYLDHAKLLLARLKPGTSNPMLEIILIPGFASNGPSESNILV